MGLKARVSNFPVGECVKNCYIKRASFKSGEFGDETWEALVFSILHRDDWVSLWIRPVDRKKFDNESKFKEKKYQVSLSIERILSLFLNKQEMNDFRKDLKNVEKGFESYCNHVISVIEAKDYKKVSIDVKTSPKEGGGTLVYPFGIFVKRSDDVTKVMRYSTWEEDRINKLLN